MNPLREGMALAGDLRSQFRDIINILSWECVEDHGFEAPFSIQVTDASGYAFSAAFVEDPDRDRPRLFGIKAPERDGRPFGCALLNLSSAELQVTEAADREASVEGR